MSFCTDVPHNMSPFKQFDAFSQMFSMFKLCYHAFTLHRSLFRTNVQSENFNSISKVRNVCCPSQLCHYAHRVQLFFCFCAFLRSSQVRSLAGDSRAKQRPEEQQLFTNQKKSLPNTKPEKNIFCLLLNKYIGAAVYVLSYV